MPKKAITRKYAMSDSDLISLLNQRRSFVERDLAEFAVYGVTQSDLDTLETDTKAIENFPSDEVYTAIVSEATEAKDAAKENVKSSIRIIMARAGNKFGDNSAKYRRFGTKGMDSLDDEHLFFLGRKVKRIAQIYLAELASEGLTQAIIDELDSKNVQFEFALEALSDSQSDRDLFAEQRIIMCNTQYDKISKLCKTGQAIWASVSEARYNDYLIYKGKLPSEKHVEEKVVEEKVVEEKVVEEKAKDKKSETK